MQTLSPEEGGSLFQELQEGRQLGGQLRVEHLKQILRPQKCPYSA